MDRDKPRGDWFGDISDDAAAYHDRFFDSHRGDFSGDANHQPQHSYPPYQYRQQHHHYQHPDHRHHYNFNAEYNDSVGSRGDFTSSHCFPLSARKRQFSHSARGPGGADGGSYVKLYVGGIPRAATEEEIRYLFEEHGDIVEVVLLKDKRTGQQQECCFVKYATLEEADRAVRALHNQYTFPGGAMPIKVKYADGERERLGSLGAPEFKLYVGCLNKQASRREIEEIFSAYGFIEDVYIVRDELRQSRGCAFIQFSHREMAVAAINALNGSYVMKGCDQPLIVRFADPKKPKTGDSRDNCKFGSSRVASRFEESVVRGAPYLNEPITGHALSKASGPLSPKTMTSSSQSPQAGGKVQTVSSTSIASELILPSSTAAHTVPISNQTEELDCDWSEHTCPDGFKYYYNRMTRESRWEKPEEYSWFEEELLKQQKQEQHQHSSSQQEQEQDQDSSCQHVHSLANPQALPHQEVS